MTLRTNLNRNTAAGTLFPQILLKWSLEFKRFLLTWIRNVRVYFCVEKNLRRDFAYVVLFPPSCCDEILSRWFCDVIDIVSKIKSYELNQMEYIFQELCVHLTISYRFQFDIPQIYFVMHGKTNIIGNYFSVKKVIMWTLESSSGFIQMLIQTLS